jgi:hypothetical protein
VIYKVEKGSNLPWPSPSRGDAKSIEGLNVPEAIAA